MSGETLSLLEIAAQALIEEAKKEPYDLVNLQSKLGKQRYCVLLPSMRSARLRDVEIGSLISIFDQDGHAGFACVVGDNEFKPQDIDEGFGVAIVGLEDQEALRLLLVPNKIRLRYLAAEVIMREHEIDRMMSPTERTLKEGTR
jgi:hypothetical protein